MTQPRELDRHELLREIRDFRESSPLRVKSLDEVQKAIREGRAL
jgi:hypothetical protein